jgi:DNA-binding phage protein
MMKTSKNKKMPPADDYHEWLVASLKDKKEAEAYLNEALREGERRYFLKALRNVVISPGRDGQGSVQGKVDAGSTLSHAFGGWEPRMESINRILAANRITSDRLFRTVPFRKVVGCAELRGKSYSIDRRHKRS